MEGKNLLWKFGLVILLVAVSLVAVRTYGLKRGPDIAGGYSMVFEVDNPKDSPNMISDVIGVLKGRIDPTGLSSLEWRPLKNSRFEVRMPAASAESKALRTKFDNACDELLKGNITRANIRAVTEAKLSPAQREKNIQALAAGDVSREAAIKKLISCKETLDKTEAALEAAKKAAKVKTNDSGKLKQLQANLVAAIKAQEKSMEDYRDALTAVRKSNITKAEILSLCRVYDKAMSFKSPDKRQGGMITFQDRLLTLKELYPTREKQIDNVVAIYKKWAKIKKPLEDPNDLKRMIRKAGVLEFRIAPFAPGHKQAVLQQKQVQEYINTLNAKGPEATIAGGDYLWLPIRQADQNNKYTDMITADYAGSKYMLLSNKPGDTMLKSKTGENAWKLDSARATTDGFGKPIIVFSMDAIGSRLMGALTSAHKTDAGAGREEGDPMAILLDEEVYSAPRVNATITSSGQIEGNFTRDEALELARILKAGSLPGRVNPEPVSESGFSASLGEENITKGIRAALIGLIAVAGFMLVYYLIAGAIADVALMLNLILILGAMSMLQAALTLPGIAGLILTIGIAVDANVLIFERLREEQARGLAVRQALKNAYERAFTAIFDANITTLLICGFLYFVFNYVGMEEVRGFAVTLGFGVAFSMFTALVVTRWCFELLLKAKIVRKPIAMLKVVPILKVNWIAKRYLFWVISATLVVIGVISLVGQRGDIWGIEFSSGTRVLVQLRDDALVDNKLPQDEVIRKKFADAADAMLGSGELDKIEVGKLTGSARVEVKLNENLQDEYIEKYGTDTDGTRVITKGSWKTQGMDEQYFAALDKNSDGLLSKAELDNLPQNTYQISTTSSNVKLIRDVINQAFGKALKRRVPCKYEIETGGNVEKMDVKLAPNGATMITSSLIAQAKASYREELMDFEGGLLFVVKDVSPAITVADLTGRIADVRTQPDFEAQAGTPTKVIGLDGNGETFTSFAILIRGDADKDLTNQNVLDEFVLGEKSVITTALEREDPTVITSFDASIAGYTTQLAMVAVVLSWLTIVAYLWLRFGSVRWGIAAVICLIHDVIIVVGLVAATGWIAGTAFGDSMLIGSFKIDLAMVAAILTVIGYSVNDTIVVFDRIRENRGKLKEVTESCINNSINQTLPRTMLTSFTTFLVVIIMYIWGGDGIRSFSYALLVGIIFGTYSSIAVASPLLLGFKYALVTRVTEDGTVEEVLEDEVDVEN